MTRPPLRLHIDRLVIDGVAPRDRTAFTRAFQQEIARRLTRVTVDTRQQSSAKLTTTAPGDTEGAARAAAAALAARLGGGRS